MGEVFWLGGASCAGKSTICSMLEANHGIERLASDPDAPTRYMKDGALDSDPRLKRLRETLEAGASLRWFFEQSPEGLADTFWTWSAMYTPLLAAELDPEEFKRVDLRVFNAARFRPAARPVDASALSTLLAEKTEYGGQIVHVDGYTTQVDLLDQLSEQGVLFGGLQKITETK